MDGFVQQASSIGGGNMTDAVMHGFAPDSVAVYRELVAQFAVCDRWFASVPSSTQPNRLFVHSGTSSGATSNNPTYVPPTLLYVLLHFFSLFIYICPVHCPLPGSCYFNSFLVVFNIFFHLIRACGPIFHRWAVFFELAYITAFRLGACGRSIDHRRKFERGWLPTLLALN
jgi:hypothetical protein